MTSPLCRLFDSDGTLGEGCRPTLKARYAA
jgi:hypothetical protein